MDEVKGKRRESSRQQNEEILGSEDYLIVGIDSRKGGIIFPQSDNKVAFPP